MVYSISAYQLGLLVDQTDRHDLDRNARRRPVGPADGDTQGLLSTVIGDNAPPGVRGTAFELFDLAVGVATFLTSTAAGLFWTFGGPALTFASGAFIAVLTLAILILRPAIVARVD